MPDRFVYVGTYTDPSAQAGYEVSVERPLMGMTGPTGSAGIYICRSRDGSHELTVVDSVSGVVNPSFIAVHGAYLFAVSEVRTVNSRPTGEAASFAIDPETGRLSLLSRVDTGGGNPCHLSVSASGSFLLVANHRAASIAVIPIDSRGCLAAPIDLHEDEQVDHRPPHAHFVVTDPSGRYVLSSDTGTDRVMAYRFDERRGRLEPHRTPWAETHRGGSPRHLSFHPNGRRLFTNGESDMTLSLFRFDPDSGSLAYLSHASTVPTSERTRSLTTAHMQVHPSGRFVYVANRGENTIAVFEFDEASDSLRRLANEPTRGLTPRYFTIDPSGSRLFVGNQNSNAIESFRIDQERGLLHYLGAAVDIPAPTCIRFGAAR